MQHPTNFWLAFDSVGKKKLNVSIARIVASCLPRCMRSEAKRLYYRRQIAAGTFVSPEPEFQSMAGYVSAGDWVLDIGANVGHYTSRLSNLVGPTGRVIAFEPVPETFGFLAANTIHFRNTNVTLVNAAASDRIRIVGMTIPTVLGESPNFYQAHLSEPRAGNLTVLAISIDSMQIPNRVSLIKIDAEGHEGGVLLGAQALLRRDRPVLIVEAGAREATDLLLDLQYSPTRLPDSPNVVFQSTLT